jgi:transposase
MFKGPDNQGSFFDTEYLCAQLIAPDSFYRKFREIVAPLIKDDDFAEMYCQNNGRPPLSPSLMALATIIQSYRGFSDREMEAACMFDIQVKYALGLKLDERPFDHSSLGDFRERLLKNGREKEIFDRVLDHLIKAGLVRKDEIQRIDATHIIADVAIPTIVVLIKKGIFNVLKPLKTRYPQVYEQCARDIHIADYSKQKINHEVAGRMEFEKRRRRLVEVVAEAKTVIEYTREVTDREIVGRIGILKRIINENTQPDADGSVKELLFKDKPGHRGDMLVSPVDEDARYGAKSITKKFMGFKANVTESVESRIITNIKPMPGNRPDGETAVETVVEAQERHGFAPPKVIADTAYSDGEYRKKLGERGIALVAPLREPNKRTRDIFPKSMFKYDEAAKTLTCPQGVTTKAAWVDRARDIHTFHFPMSKCKVCPVQKQCTRTKEGRRTVGIGATNAELRAAEIYNATPEFKRDMRLRPAIEGKLSELKRWHGLTRARFRGLVKLGLQCYFAAAVVNIKRWFKLITGSSPGLRAAPGAA